MPRHLKFLCILSAFLVLSGNSWAVSIYQNGSTITYGTSSDPSPNKMDIQGILESRYNSYTNLSLTLVNGMSDEVETWFGQGVGCFIIDEIAGYSGNTTFGWYNAADPDEYKQIFAGSAGKGAYNSIAFADPINFGFYIDPNGISANRLFSQHERNNGSYQVTVWQINDSPYDYILGWEDILLGSGGDKDYQDMILQVHVNPVPEPTTMLLLGSGLICLAGFTRKFKR